MPHYLAYELTVASDLELPGLPPALPGAVPDVEVVCRSLDLPELVCTEDGSRIGAFYGETARFLIEGGRRITVDVVGPADPGDVESRVLGEIFAALLRQRGLLVLHACAVERGGEAVAFVGESGWGKSTLADAFCRRGYALVTDDVMALSVHSGRPVVVASYPQIRLRPDSARHAAPDGAGLSPVYRNGPKLARADVRMAAPGVPLRALYVLEPQFRAETGVEDMPPTRALLDLVQHTRARTIIQANVPGLLRDHLGQCEALLRGVRTAVLRRRQSFGAISEVIAAVEADLGCPSAGDGASGRPVASATE